MKVNLNGILCADCKKKIKLAKKSARCVSKLKTRTDATYQQKQSWKYHIANAMRSNPTPAEAKLKEVLKAAERQHRWSLSFQKQIGPYIVDACIVNRSIVIEADGAVHKEQQEYDAARDKFIRREGYKVLRFSNEDILKNWPKVLAEIARVPLNG